MLDRSARAGYQAAGITADPATHRRPAPLLCDLVRALEAESETGKRLAERLSPYATGSHSSLFDRPTSVQPDSHLVCFSLRGLPERMSAPALLLTLDAIWRSLEGPLRRRVVLVDEAWDLMRERERDPRGPGARFLFRLAKKARKRWTGLTTITQDAGDLLDSRARPGRRRTTPPSISCCASRRRRSSRSGRRSSSPPASAPTCSAAPPATACCSPASSESRCGVEGEPRRAPARDE